MGHDRAVSIATCQGLDGPRFVSRRGRDFPQSSRLAPGPRQPPAQWLLDLFPRVKVAGGGGGWREPHTPSSALVNEWVELYTNHSKPTIALICIVFILKHTIKHLKSSYMFRSTDHHQGAHVVPCWSHVKMLKWSVKHFVNSTGVVAAYRVSMHVFPIAGRFLMVCESSECTVQQSWWPVLRLTS
jgi:hypothetical protein